MAAFSYTTSKIAILDLNFLKSMVKEILALFSMFQLFRFNKRPKGRTRLKVFGAFGLFCLFSAFQFAAVSAFAVFSQEEPSETEYIYNYDVHLGIKSGGSEFGGQERTSDLKISSTLAVSPMWSSKSIALVRFKITKPRVKFSQNGENSKADVKDLLQQIPDSDFHVQFDGCQPTAIFSNHQEEDLTTDFIRGLASMFQFRTSSWKGTEVDIDGNCTVHYNVDHRGVHKIKSGCVNDPKDSGVRGTSTSKSHQGFYQLQPGHSGLNCQEMKEVIKKSEMTQKFHHFVSLVPKVGSVISTKQSLTLKEQLDFEGSLGDFKDIKEAVNFLQKEFKLERRSIKSGSSYSTRSNLEINGSQLKSLFKKHKRNLKPASLATVESAASFKKLLKAISASTKLTRDDIKNLLEDNIKEHGLEIMDILGSSKNIQGHKVALDTFNDQAKADLGERYLWALAQIQDCPAELASDLLAIADARNVRGNLEQTLVLTIGGLARNTPPGMSSRILQWLVNQLTECKGEDCIVLFVKAMRNSQSPSVAPVLLELAKADDSKVIAVEAMKALFSLPLKESRMAIGANKFTDEMMHLFTNRRRDSSIRGMAAELIAKGMGTSDNIKTILTNLGQEKKEFTTYVLKRLIDLTKYHSNIRDILRKMVKKHILNWNLLATGAVSESFSRVLAQSEAGNFSFSFDLEVAGLMLKRSNTEVFLSSPQSCEESECQKYGFYGLDTFGGGMQQYLGSEGLDENEIDMSEPYAGMQITVNNNLMRPFIFFTSSSELMSLYWSGATEQKTSAIQFNIPVQDTSEVLMTSSGLAVGLKSFGALSFDSSGSAAISIWSRQAMTNVENVGAYHLDYQCTLLSPLKVNHKEVFEGRSVLEVTTDLDWSDDYNMCIKVQIPPTQLKYKRVQSGRPSVTRMVKHEGKTVFLTDAINRLCSKMVKSL